MKNLKQKVKKLFGKQDHAVTDGSVISSCSGEMKRELQEQQKQLQQEQKRLQQHEDLFHEQEQKVTDQKEKLEQQQKQLQQQQEQITQQQYNDDNNITKQQQQQQQLEQLQEKQHKQDAQLQLEQNQLQQQKEQFHKQEQKVADQKEQMEQQQKQLEQQREEIKQQHDNDNENVNKMQQQKQQLDQLQQHQQSLDAQLQEEQKQLQKQEEQFHKQAQKVAEQQEQLKKQQEQINQQIANENENQKKRQEQQQQLEQLQEEQQKLEAQLQQEQELLHQQKEQFQKQAETVANHEIKMEQHLEQLKQQQDQIKQQQHENNENKQKLNEQQKKLEQQQNDRDEQHETLIKQQQQIEKQIEQLEDQKKQFEEQQKKENELQKELQEKQNKLEQQQIVLEQQQVQFQQQQQNVKDQLELQKQQKLLETTLTKCCVIEQQQETTLIRNCLLAECELLEKSWQLSFELKPTGLTKAWTNIFHCTTRGDHGKHGYRTPAVWFHANSTLLHICHSVNGNSNYSVNPKTSLPMNEWSIINISQFSPRNGVFVYRVQVNDDIYQTENTETSEFANVKIFCSDDFYPAAKAIIRKLKFDTYPNNPINNSFETSTAENSLDFRSLYPSFATNKPIISFNPETMLKKNNLCAEVGLLGKSYKLSLEVKPTGLSNGWTNIFHCTTGANSGKYGNRTPAIFVFAKTTKLHICSAVNGNSNMVINPPNALPMNMWSKIEISQLATREGVFIYRIKVNDEVQEIVNDTPSDFANVKVFCADNFYPPAKAIIRNLNFQTFLNE